MMETWGVLGFAWAVFASLAAMIFRSQARRVAVSRDFWHARYDDYLRTRALLDDLVGGVEKWAADEDGVHYQAWDAYLAARRELGLHLPRIVSSDDATRATTTEGSEA